MKKMFLYGADYNPEQWKNYPEILDEDIRLMKKAGCNVMSVGIFAWTELEPEEGKFDFSFFDRVINRLYENGIYVFLATPSGARPAWMSLKYPEVLRTDERGIKHKHGGRHNHCFTSPIYREKVNIINTELAKRYGNHPGVIGWHVSNEYSGDCHCELCKNAFREWLKKKYKTLDNLNEQWWTGFWSHTYTAWEQIDPPSEIGENALHGLTLDWRRFATDQTLDFYIKETEPLKKYSKNKLITTNFHGYIKAFEHINYWKFKDYVDIIAWDAYPEWKGTEEDKETRYIASFVYDMCRSYKNKPFLLMESTPSNVNWREYMKLKKPGMNMFASLQAVACGADSVQYFQWRKSRGSSEKLHGAVVDHEGSENSRVFKEVSELGAVLSKISGISESHTKAKAAVIYDVENNWAMKESQGFIRSDKKYDEECIAHYKNFVKKGININIIDSEEDFSQYEIVVAPMLYMLKKGVAERLKDFVKNGGILISTFMSGYVNENDLCHLGGFPGDGLMELFGIWNEEIDTIYPGQSNTVSYKGKKYSAVDYCEFIHLKTAESLGTYNDGYIKDTPAVTVNNFGNGKAYYLAFKNDNDFLENFYNDILSAGHNFGENLYVKEREDEEKYYYFIQNWNDSDEKVKLDKTYTNEMTDDKVSGNVTLGSLETLVLSCEK